MQHYFNYDQIDLNIERDPSTKLPLFSEQEKILSLVLNYLPLPYTVAEFGCGKKVSLIIKKLLDLGVPYYGIKRGMIMERDMSPAVLKEKDHHKRQHALTMENQLYHRVDYSNDIQMNMFREAGVEIDRKKEFSKTGHFKLSHKKTLQFAQARSHIFTIISFWDEKAKKVKDRVIDPTIDDEELFLVRQIRKYLHASEGVIFSAYLLENFHLEEEYLTESQVKALDRILKGRELNPLEQENYYKDIADFLGAKKGSIGDPATWTYANNMPVADHDHHRYQLMNTGKGNKVRRLFEQMRKARMLFNEEIVVNVSEQLQAIGEEVNVTGIVQEDANWSEMRLLPLTHFVNTLSDHTALEEINERLERGEPLHSALTKKNGFNLTFGISFRLRQRIEDIARVSRNELMQIDARALNERFAQASITCIEQMNRAGLKVFIDKVGNIHGLLIDDDTLTSVTNDPEKLGSLTNKSICHCSHIDTVLDGGKYDGRLGVLSGIEVAQLLYDLDRHYKRPARYASVNNPVMVTAFIGEEMTFTGEGVSMPGSAAVSGLSTVEQVHQMTNHDGEIFRDKLLELLAQFKQEKHNNRLDIVNDWHPEDTEDELLEKCFDPALFYTSHTYERHIEQGNNLDTAEVPLALVKTVMGIHQEDFVITGKQAEEAALALIGKIRELSMEKQFENLRATSGVFESIHLEEYNPLPVDFGVRWTLLGRKNHAGATKIKDRQDAGVAAARMADFFINLVRQKNNGNGAQISPYVGGLEIAPGTNRNVIPDTAKFTLGICGKNIDDHLKSNLQMELHNFIGSKLCFPVADGGEGVISGNVHEVNYINKPTAVRTSIDLRGASKKSIYAYLKALGAYIDHLQKYFDVTIDRHVEQLLDPYDLDVTGQVLQLERSYGGSHNPNETELARDVLGGTILQLAVTRDFMEREQPANLNLYKLVEQYIPDDWKQKLPSLVSGALHDTCNICAAGRLESEELSRQ